MDEHAPARPGPDVKSAFVPVERQLNTRPFAPREKPTAPQSQTLSMIQARLRGDYTAAMPLDLQAKLDWSAKINRSQFDRGLTPTPATVQTKHELPSVVQQNSQPQIQKKGEGVKSAKLHIHADLDAPGMALKDQLQSGAVGHAWISLEWKDPTHVPDTIPANHKTFLEQGGVQADPMGFWPRMFDTFDPITQQWSNLPDDQRVGYSSNPFKSYVPGQMVHPDTLHQSKATQSYDITADQAFAAIQYAESKRNAEYSVFFYNCTTFAKEAAKAANVSPPNMGTAGICYPDALYKSIVNNQKKNIGTTSVDDGSGNMVTVEGQSPKKG